MDKIIERAISGGYEKERYHWDENGNWDWEPEEVMLMKKEFWVSLGKACGWRKHEMDNRPHPGYVYTALQFHELNLTTSFEEAVAWLGKVVEG